MNYSDPVAVESRLMALGVAVDTIWLLVTGIGILLMQVGFALLETGMISSKNVKGTLLKNLSDNAIGAVVWVSFGWGLYTGTNPFASGDTATVLNNHHEAQFAKIFQQFGFAASATTVVSGAVLGRCRFTAYLLFSFLSTGIFYPIVAHWAWNSNGWLSQLGFVDFAGGAVVHVYGGCAALAGAIICGPRYGRFYDDVSSKQSATFSQGSSGDSKLSDAIAFVVNIMMQCTKRFCPRLTPIIGILSGNSDYLRPVRDMPEHSIVLHTLGGLFLYIGWFSFNAGSASVLDVVDAQIAARAALNTLLASGSGTVFALGFCYLLRTKLDLRLIVNSMLTCTVVITPCAGYVELWVALVAGPISVVVFTFFRFLILHGAGIDDPLDVFAVHAGGGLVGMIVLGVLDRQRGFFYTGDARFLGVEMLGTLAIGAWGFFFSLLFFTVTDKTYPKGVKYSRDDQLAGLDFMHFQMESQADLDWITVQEFNVRERVKREQAARRVLKRRVPGGVDSSNNEIITPAESIPAQVVPVNSFHGNNLGVLVQTVSQSDLA